MECSCYIYFATKVAPPLLAAVFVAFLQKFAIVSTMGTMTKTHNQKNITQTLG